MILSQRLLAIAKMIDQDQIVLDIGTDHGLLPIYLVSEGKTPLAIASDVKSLPLNQAKKNVAAANLEDKIKLVLSDGLESITSYFTTLIIAGVGPRTIINILEAGLAKIKNKTLILQSNVSAHIVRQWLNKNGFKIVDEALVLENDNYYEIIKAIPGKQFLSNSDFFLGPVLKRNANEVVRNYYNNLAEKYKKILARIPKRDAIKKMLHQEIYDIFNKKR
jgi:tRNA (adenine22-N1)-methyltransferase